MLSGASEELASLLNKRRSVSVVAESMDNKPKVSGTSSTSHANNISEKYNPRCTTTWNDAGEIEKGVDNDSIKKPPHEKRMSQYPKKKEKRKEDGDCNQIDELNQKSFSSSSSWILSSPTGEEDSKSCGVISIASSLSSISRKSKYQPRPQHRGQQKPKKKEMLPSLIEVPTVNSSSNRMSLKKKREGLSSSVHSKNGVSTVSALSFRNKFQQKVHPQKMLDISSASVSSTVVRDDAVFFPKVKEEQTPKQPHQIDIPPPTTSATSTNKISVVQGNKTIRKKLLKLNKNGKGDNKCTATPKALDHNTNDANNLERIDTMRDDDTNSTPITTTTKPHVHDQQNKGAETTNTNQSISKLIQKFQKDKKIERSTGTTTNTSNTKSSSPQDVVSTSYSNSSTKVMSNVIILKTNSFQASSVDQNEIINRTMTTTSCSSSSSDYDEEGEGVTPLTSYFNDGIDVEPQQEPQHQIIENLSAGGIINSSKHNIVANRIKNFEKPKQVAVQLKPQPCTLTNQENSSPNRSNTMDVESSTWMNKKHNESFSSSPPNYSNTNSALSSLFPNGSSMDKLQTSALTIKSHNNIGINKEEEVLQEKLILTEDNSNVSKKVENRYAAKIKENIVETKETNQFPKSYPQGTSNNEILTLKVRPQTTTKQEKTVPDTASIPKKETTNTTTSTPEKTSVTPRWKKKMELTNSIHPKRGSSINTSIKSNTNTSLRHDNTQDNTVLSNSRVIPPHKKNVMRASFLDKIIKPSHLSIATLVKESLPFTTPLHTTTATTTKSHGNNSTVTTKQGIQDNTINAITTKKSSEEDETNGTTSTVTESDITSSDNNTANTSFVIGRVQQHLDDTPSLKSSSMEVVLGNSDSSQYTTINPLSTINLKTNLQSQQVPSDNSNSWLCCPVTGSSVTHDRNEESTSIHPPSSSIQSYRHPKHTIAEEDVSATGCNTSSIVSLPRPYKTETTTMASKAVSSTTTNSLSSSKIQKDFISTYQQLRVNPRICTVEDEDDCNSVDSITSEIRKRSWSNQVDHQCTNNDPSTSSSSGVVKFSNKTQLTVVTSLSPYSNTTCSLSNTSKDIINTMLSPPKKIHQKTNTNNTKLVSPKYVNKGQVTIPSTSSTLDDTYTFQSGNGNNIDLFKKNIHSINHSSCFDSIPPSSDENISKLPVAPQQHLQQQLTLNRILVENQRLKEKIQSFQKLNNTNLAHTNNNTPSSSYLSVHSSDYLNLNLKDQVTSLQSLCLEKDKIIFMLKKKLVGQDLNVPSSGTNSVHSYGSKNRNEPSSLEVANTTTSSLNNANSQQRFLC